MDKNPLESRGVWGAVGVLIIYSIQNFTDIQITEEELQNLLVNIGVIGAGVLALYGRIKAEGPIKFFSSNTLKINIENATPEQKAKLQIVANQLNKESK